MTAILPFKIGLVHRRVGGGDGEDGAGLLRAEKCIVKLSTQRS